MSVYKYRYLTTSQVHRLHFPSLQTAGRRLRALRAAGYLKAQRLLGLKEHLDGLTEDGANLVAGYLGVPLADLLWTPPTERLIADAAIRHVLAVNDFRIALLHACARSTSVELLGFVPGHVETPTSQEERRRYVRDVVSDARPPGQKTAHHPDGAFALRTRDETRLYFVEIDRRLALSSDAQRSLAHLLDLYDGFWVDATYQRYRDDFVVPQPFKGFRVLLIVQTPQRMQAIKTMVQRRAHVRRSECFVWLRDRPALKEQTILTARWTPLRPTRGELCTLSGAPAMRVASPARIQRAAVPDMGSAEL